MDLENDIPSDEQILSEVTKASEVPADVPQEVTPAEQSALTFKTPDELLKHSLKYTANGKEISEPIETVLKRASQGYNYAQRMAEIKAQEAQWQKQLEESKSLADKYREIDEYARQNPDWFNHWNNAYQNRSQGFSNSPEQSGFDPNQITGLIEQKLQPHLGTLQEMQDRLNREKVEQENKLLDSQVQKTKQNYADVDFSASDPESGKTLEFKVYELMAQKGYDDFETAYKVLDHDNIVARQIEKAKADLVKAEQQKRKQGIVAEKSAKKPDAVNYKQVPENKLIDDALAYVEELKTKGGKNGINA